MIVVCVTCYVPAADLLQALPERYDHPAKPERDGQEDPRRIEQTQPEDETNFERGHCSPPFTLFNGTSHTWSPNRTMRVGTHLGASSASVHMTVISRQ